MFVRASLLGALLAALAGYELAGCEPYISGSVYTCTHPDIGHIGPDGEPDPCHYEDVDDGTDGGADGGTDAGDDADAHPEARCVGGEYAHWRLPWQPPTLLWFGPPDQVPECPLGPTTISYEGHTDLVAPAACEACTCDPPTGSCALPSTLTASTLACNIPGGASTSFNSPDPWDGSCDSTTQVPGGFAHSLMIDPIAMTENGCAPGPTIPAKVISLHWDTVGRGCDVGLPMGPTERSVCLPPEPIEPAEPGFKACIFFNDEIDCPSYDEPGNVFTERHIFYGGVQDDRQCSPCTCGAPTGSACSATISIYKGNDLTCSGPTFAQMPISSVDSVCLDITLPNQSLGSKSAAATTYLPGTCQPSGGDASGSATKIHPATLCCRP
jgi:hypothetical protein